MAALMLLCSCSDKRYIEPFSMQEEICMELGGRLIFKYNPGQCQLSFNRDRCEFRVSTDNMSDFYSLTLSEIPSEQGQEVTGSLIWTTPSDIYTKRNVTFETIKLEGNMIWLWTHNGRIGVVVRMLD